MSAGSQRLELTGGDCGVDDILVGGVRACAASGYTRHDRRNGGESPEIRTSWQLLLAIVGGLQSAISNATSLQPLRDVHIRKIELIVTQIIVMRILIFI